MPRPPREIVTPLKLTATLKSAETDPLHWTEKGETTALCGATDQRRSTQVERWERTRCWDCTCEYHLIEEDAR